MGWPQILILCWAAANLAYAVANSGRNMPLTYSPWRTLQHLTVLGVMLWGCGFFGTVHAADLPEGSYRYRALLMREAQAIWGPTAPTASLAAQLHQESRWRTDAVSAVGARGMAQVMPATATWLASSNASLKSGAITTPTWDIRALVTYDRWLWQRTHAVNDCEHMAKVGRAYNGGLGWLYKDERKALYQGINEAINFDQLDTVNAGRSAAAFRENVQYPRLILLKFEPIYVKAGFGQGVCTALLSQSRKTGPSPWQRLTQRKSRRAR
jgi:hypothetical protein